MNVLSDFYKSMLKEMRDVVRDLGKFYTPRAVVTFMANIAPQVSETIHDSAFSPSVPPLKHLLMANLCSQVW